MFKLLTLLALAALRRSNQVHGVLDFERYLRSVLSRQQPVHTISELTTALNNIDSVRFGTGQRFPWFLDSALTIGIILHVIIIEMVAGKYKRRDAWMEIF